MGREKTYSCFIMFCYWEAVPLTLYYLGTCGCAFYLLKHLFAIERFLEFFSGAQGLLTIGSFAVLDQTYLDP